MHKVGIEVKATRDLYKLLGLPREASQDDIRKAHRKLVRKHHPDAKLGDRSSEERFKEIQRAYEVLSDPDKRREYDKKLRPSSRGSSSRPRATAGRRTKGESAATPPKDLSDLLSKLSDLSSNRSGESIGGKLQLGGEELARLAKLLGVDISRVSELLGKDIGRLSKLVGENIEMNTKVDPGDAQSGRFSTADETASGSERSVRNKDPRAKRARGPKAQRKEKRVKGPKAQRKRKYR
jgi:curved DNA-binding protein CbpA